MAKPQIKTVFAEVDGFGEDTITVEIPVQKTKTEKSIVTELRTIGLRSFDSENNRAVWVHPADIKNILVDFE